MAIFSIDMEITTHSARSNLKQYFVYTDNTRQFQNTVISIVTVMLATTNKAEKEVRTTDKTKKLHNTIKTRNIFRSKDVQFRVHIFLKG